MNSRKTTIVLCIAGIVALCWLSAPFWGHCGASKSSVSGASLLFDEGQGFQVARDFVTRNPKRVLGSIEARQATGFLRDFLKLHGYEVPPPTYFDAMIAGRRQVGSNVVAFKSGALPGFLAVAAHYDTARTTVHGAMANGAAVGVMLELARVFSGSPLRHGLLILATDGAEWGMLGAADFCQNDPRRGAVAAALSLDFVSVGELAELRVDADGQWSGYAPGWLRRLASRSAEIEKLPVRSPAGLQELIQRAMSLPISDQGPFLHAGIPAVNLGSGSIDKELEREVYHAPNDAIENVKPASLGIYGRTAERILRSLDEMEGMPQEMDGAFRWRGDSYISGWAMTLLPWLTFLPLAASLYFLWREQHRSLRAGAVLRETTFFMSWLVPFGLGYSLILFCRLMRLLPHNSLYPGPLNDPMLQNPPWGVLAGIFAAAVAVGIGLHFLARYLTRGLSVSCGASRAVLTALFSIVVLLALLYDRYWAVAFLAVPALVWSNIKRGRSLAARLAGALAILAAGLMLYVAVSLAGRNPGMGIDAVYDAVLGLSNGMFRWQGYFLAASAVVLGLRFLTLQITDADRA